MAVWRRFREHLDLPRLEVRLDFVPDVRLPEGDTEPIIAVDVRAASPASAQPLEAQRAMQRQPSYR